MCNFARHYTSDNPSTAAVSHTLPITHRQLKDKNLDAIGVTENLILVSVGIKHIDDLLQDLDRVWCESEGAA